MKRRHVLLCTAGVIVASSLVVRALAPRESDASGVKVSLTLAHILPSSHSVHASLQFLAYRLSELSSGSVELRVVGGGQLGTEPESVEQLRSGTLAAAKVSAGVLEDVVPEMAVFGMPYLFRDDEHYWSVLLGPIGKDILAAAQPRGLHAIAYYESGSRSFYTVKRPIERPADVKGMRLRVQPSRQASEMITVLGGTPAPLAYGDVFAALQRGAIDGAENNPPSFYTSGHYQLAKHYSIDEHTRVPDVIVVSQKVWDGLTPQVRGWIERAAADSVPFQRTLWREQTEDALREMQKAGVTVYHPDTSAFAAVMGSMYTQADGTRLGELAWRIMAK